jgi:hypothetical protein
MSGSTWAQRRAFVPAARRDRAVTSDARKPSCGPRKVTAALRAAVISAGFTDFVWFIGHVDTR